MIRRFIDETYIFYDLDKKTKFNQLPKTFERAIKARKLLHYSKYVLLLVQAYY